MRLSVLKGDPGYFPGTPGVRVFLDGVEQKHTFTADEERGLLVVADLDEQGRVRLNPERTEVLKKTLRGRVQIEIPAGSVLALSLGDR